MTETPCPNCGTPVLAGARFCGECAQPVTAEQAAVTTSNVPVGGGAGHQDPDLALLIEATQGEFEIKGRIGKGGMGAVYLADDPSLNRDVAIKIMIGGGTRSDGSQERFERESITTARLAHPHIIPIYGVRNYESPTGAELHFFVMKYIAGDSIDNILKKAKKFSVSDARLVLVQVGQALQFAHEEGVIHRDIKPGNIMIDKQGFACVADFGIAKEVRLSKLTQDGYTMGSPPYMSPEQYEAKTTGASDQYSLGVVAFELISGRTPFLGDTQAEMMRQHLLEPPPSLVDLVPECPIELSQIIGRMLEKNPEERFPSMERAVAALKKVNIVEDDEAQTQLLKWASEGATSVVPVVPTEVTTAFSPKSSPPVTFESGISIVGEAQAALPRRRTRSLVLMATSVVLLGGLGWAQWSGMLNFGGNQPVASMPFGDTTETTDSVAPVSVPDTTSLVVAEPETQPPATIAAPPPRERPRAPEPARLIVTGLPANGRILIDDLFQPEPDFELRAGRYDLRLEAAGYETDVLSVTLGAGDVRTVPYSARAIQVAEPPTEIDSVTTPPDSGTVQVVVNPSADVSINGRGLGRSRSFEQTVVAGEPVCISVRHGEYMPLDTVVTIEPDEVKRIVLTLMLGSASAGRPGC